MKSQSSYSLASDLRADRDRDLMELTGSIIEVARAQWPDRLVTEPNASGNPALLYTETHYALATVLLCLNGSRDRALLDLAASRLRLWNEANGPMTFFNAMAVCLTAIIFARSGERHVGLESILSDLIARAREHRSVAYPQWCGNNAYLQQVAVDMVLLPVARGREVTTERVNYLVAEFNRYRTPEGFFYDLPRNGTEQEPLCPPTYIMKMLFLAGICHELHPVPALAHLFQSGMAAVLPLLTREGHFSYFGRTDNSPFAAGLTIFNLRQAARMSPDRGGDYEQAAVAAERYYATFPRTPSGMLQCNRFADAQSPAELQRSRDDYAYVGQYSLSSCAYTLLGCTWFPESIGRSASRRVTDPHVPSVATSRDLGLVKLNHGDAELVLRTRSELTSWDRRYLGPTILRYEQGGHLLVGAISRTVSTATAIRPRRGGRVRKAWALFRDRFVNGIEQLDGASVGFLPVLRRGAIDYLPYRVVAHEASPERALARYHMVQLHARGWRPCLIESTELLNRNLPPFRSKRYSCPPMKAVDALELERVVYLTPEGCRIQDRIVGNLRGTTLLFSVRYLPNASVRVRGLSWVRSETGWGSDGRQTLELYSAAVGGSEIQYECEIESSERLGR